MSNYTLALKLLRVLSISPGDYEGWTPDWEVEIADETARSVSKG